MSFLPPPETSPEAQRLFDEDVAELGYVMNTSRLWAYRPETLAGLSGLLREIADTHGFTRRRRGILVTACASALGDSYCSLAWGLRLAEETGPGTAAGVLGGDDEGLTEDERVMAAWARKVARDPNSTGEADVAALREAGFGDTEIFAMTAFVALRVAFSTVNDALGARPDAALRSTAPREVLDAVTYGRPIE
ncbi:carboxymuconolactone decarboxylase family protein [Nonomuraea roseola]|uniref:Carboxymuconolactone decarboxylase family protein n=1 Tax=Nonomuraea roseola TaxID=46179 RepID=A0ABV5Q6K5_9ACTN